MGWESCAQVGSMVATYCLETQGGQEYRFTRSQFLDRFEESYGPVARAMLEESYPRS